MQIILFQTCTSSHIAPLGVQGQHCSFQNTIRDLKHLYHISAQALRVNSVGKEVLAIADSDSVMMQERKDEETTSTVPMQTAQIIRFVL